VRTLARGLIAGAAGTVALDMVTYLDMALRGRPESTTPQQTVRRLADLVGVDLGEGEQADNRAAGIGAVLGYATGLAVAVGYVSVARRPQPWPRSAARLVAIAMLGSNVPMTVLGVTDPRRWSATDWVSDVVAHLAYGAVAAAVDHQLRRTTS
jgi:drug/metabolite transporter (DMT)-like permease